MGLKIIYFAIIAYKWAWFWGIWVIISVDRRYLAHIIHYLSNKTLYALRIWNLINICLSDLKYSKLLYVLVVFIWLASDWPPIMHLVECGGFYLVAFDLLLMAVEIGCVWFDWKIDWVGGWWWNYRSLRSLEVALPSARGPQVCSPDSPIAPIAGSRMTEGHLRAADRRSTAKLCGGGGRSRVRGRPISCQWVSGRRVLNGAAVCSTKKRPCISGTFGEPKKANWK